MPTIRRHIEKVSQVKGDSHPPSRSPMRVDTFLPTLLRLCLTEEGPRRPYRGPSSCAWRYLNGKRSNEIRCKKERPWQMPRPFVPMQPLLSAPARTPHADDFSLDHRRPSGSCIGEVLPPALPALPSQFPNGRLTARASSSCTYSNGCCSGLQPDFLIPASVRTDSLHAEHDAAYEVSLLLHYITSV